MITQEYHCCLCVFFRRLCYTELQSSFPNHAKLLLPWRLLSSVLLQVCYLNVIVLHSTMTQHSFNYSQRFHTYMTNCYCSDISWSYCLSTIFYMYFFFLYKNCNCVRTLAAGLCYIRVLIHCNAVFVVHCTCSTVHPGFCSLLLCHMYYVANCVACPCRFALPFFLAYCLPDRRHFYMSAYFLVWILYFQAHHAILFLVTCNLCCYLACMYMYCSCFWCALPLFINMLLLLVSPLFLTDCLSSYTTLQVVHVDFYFKFAFFKIFMWLDFPSLPCSIPLKCPTIYDHH